MPTDIFKGVFYTAGEGADVADLNNMRGFGDARLLDQILEHLVGGPLGGTEPDAGLYGAHGGNAPLGSTIPIAYTLTAGEAYLFADGSPGNELRIAPGTVFQKLSAKNGDEPSFLAYEIGASDFAFTIANGDATNQRVDLVQIKLEYVTGNSESRIVEDPPPSGAQSVQTINKKRRIQATCSVKAGTPAATPVFPAPDAGFVALGAVRVPATWTSANGLVVAGGIIVGQALMMQLSSPMKVTPHVVMPQSFDYEGGATDWSLNSNGLAAAGAAATGLLVHCPVMAGRIVGVAVAGNWVTSGSVVLVGFTMNASGVTNIFTMSTLTSLVSVGGGFAVRHATAADVADGDSVTDPASAGSLVGSPYWADGHRGPRRPYSNGQASWLSGAVRIAAGNTSSVGPVVFWVAG